MNNYIQPIHLFCIRNWELLTEKAKNATEAFYQQIYIKNNFNSLYISFY